MHRLFRLSLLVVMLSVLALIESNAKPQVFVSGRIAPDEVRVFLKDSTYIVNKQLVVGGTLIIEPGTEIYFYPNGRIVDSVGGRIIADGLAEATYNPLPNGWNPRETGVTVNPEGWTGYEDLDYFLFEDNTGTTISVDTEAEPTVHANKYDYIYNVVLNTTERKLKQLTPGAVLGADEAIISFEKAMMFTAARLATDPDQDLNLSQNPWRRINDKPVDIEANRIKFYGQPVDNFSREYGHFVILPGARTAFFRDCDFEGFRKDTTVDRIAIYDQQSFPGLTEDQIETLNYNLVQASNGTGGVITTFSSRTWLLNCDFTYNTARHKGGAVAIMQAVDGYPEVVTPNEYRADKNPNLINHDRTISDINSRAANVIPAVDMIDEPDDLAGNAGMEPFTDYERQSWDDGRLAVYLGRMRNLTFTRNYVELANIITQFLGGHWVVMPDHDNPCKVDQHYGDIAYGGAIYIGGKSGELNRQIEVGFGINNSINNSEGEINIANVTGEFDTFVAVGNSANNYQNNGASHGARGGVIYVGPYTSLILSGQFHDNMTNAKFLQTAEYAGITGLFSMGGAVYLENTFGRLQVFGGPDRNGYSNPTEFLRNISGSGGAIYVDGHAAEMMSPIIGGAENTISARDLGYNIKFEYNEAYTNGGAIYTKRNMLANGAGGVDNASQALIGYGGEFPLRFHHNKAGFSGGAISIEIPDGIDDPVQRVLHFTRSEFVENAVGEIVEEVDRTRVKGGGAIYTVQGDLNLVKGCLFEKNTVLNGSGGAIALVNPTTSFRRFFVSDIDEIKYEDPVSPLIATSFISNDDVLTYSVSDADRQANTFNYVPDVRMLTRFIENEVDVDSVVMAQQNGSGTTQIGKGTVVTSESLMAVAFTDRYNGFAVGSNGKIVKFANGGDNWYYRDWTDDPYVFQDVYFTTSQVGFVVGEKSVILRSTNGGDNWTKVNDGVNQLNAITFAGTQFGAAVGQRGDILLTNDNGVTWAPIPAKITTQNLNAVYFRNTTHGIAVGDNGTIIITEDGGLTWDVRNANTFVSFKDIYFTDQDNGFIVGDLGYIYTTTNGGDSWEYLQSDPTTNYSSVFFTSLTTGYITADGGAILKTIDAGQTWAPMVTPVTFPIYDIYFPSTDYGYAVGGLGTIIKTENAEDWTDINPTDQSVVDVRRTHPETELVENGVGLGGALYILDRVTLNRNNREDSVRFNRVRIQDNKSYTGAGIYSDNYDLKLIFSRSLITGNEVTSKIGAEQNSITGPVIDYNEDGVVDLNFASSDLAGTVLYGEILGPIPSFSASEAGNSIYANNARFLVRLPDAPNTKGVLAGTTGIGFGGVDTLRGNYWGYTDANVNLVLPNKKFRGIDENGDTLWYELDWPAVQETFFVDSDGQTHLKFMRTAGTPLEQGPFEYFGMDGTGAAEVLEQFTYNPIPLANGTDENTPAAGTIAEKLLMSGKIYDIYDKGTDIKTVDYSNRRMSPIEDFAVGIPPVLKRYDNADFPSEGKYVRRLLRDPEIVDSVDENGNLIYPFMSLLQDEFRPDEDGNYYHPIGYPVYLETMIDYSGDIAISNHDPRLLNESVFFVINETTGDFIRVNLRQISEEAPYREIFRTRFELVPDLTNRHTNYTLRRTAQGLANLGIGDFLMRQLRHNPYNEDKGTLPGRRYYGQENKFADVTPTIFSNRNENGQHEMPASNNGEHTFFAGERYTSLPVNVGDVVRIISRTVLWREDVVDAYDDGIAFTVEESTEPPLFTGNVIDLQINPDTVIKPSEYPWKRDNVDKFGNPDPIPDTVIMTEFLNKIFVTEDRLYPAAPGTYTGMALNHGQGRDSILSITGVDTNQFYDPRSIFRDMEFSQLSYSWSVSPQSGLARWLLVDTIPAGENTVQNPRDEALGYMVFRGQPINPYVVPAGEKVDVSVRNYPPHYRNVDNLNGINIGADTVAQFVNIFRPYLFAEAYDTENARYLQQDTIDCGTNYESEYSFHIFVVDSTPRFLPAVVDTILESDKEIVERRINMAGDMETYVVYLPTLFTCDTTDEGQVKANLTDKLRFQIDFNTDDEMEDDWAVNWDFRYGKTAYGFWNIAIRNNDFGGNGADTAVVDTTVYDLDMDGANDDTLITQTRPIWMSNKYMYRYGSEDPADLDEFAVDLTSNGQINIRIDETEARQLLTPQTQYNGALNTDTTFTIVVNDGHGGLNFMDVDVFVNIKPLITNDNLPMAVEDIDYNPELLDSNKMIKVFDPNFEQIHSFELIYQDYPEDQIPKDPCYDEAGFWDVSDKKTTPEWLRINPISGLLFGTPGVKDAPRTEQVTVLVTDEDGLTDLRTFTLVVDSTNHAPHITASPIVRCVDKGQAYEDTIMVWDYDLNRDENNAVEVLTIEVIQPSSGFEVIPSTITGPTDEDTIKVVIRTDNFDVPRDPDGKVTIIVRVTDASGVERELVYRLKYSLETDFIAPISVRNSKSALQRLEFGTAQSTAQVRVTTGDGLEGEGTLGMLDSAFCEYELPPIPHEDIFDARWYIPLTNGVHRNVFPRANSGVNDERVYRCIFQSGGEAGNTSNHYPIYITWNSEDIPAKDDQDRNPTGSSWFIRDDMSNGNIFSYNMSTGVGHSSSDIKLNKTNEPEYTLEVNRVSVKGFVIVHDWASPVNEYNLAIQTGISKITPNPMSNNTDITFGVQTAGKVSIDVIDGLGNIVAVITDAYYQPGEYKLNWTGRDDKGTPLPSGTYRCRMSSGPHTSVETMVIVK